MKRLIAIMLVLILTISLCSALAEYTDSDTILAVQQALADLGIYKGNISGIKGNATEAAIRTYQQKNGLKATGQIDDDLLDLLGLLSDEESDDTSYEVTSGENYFAPYIENPSDFGDMRRLFSAAERAIANDGLAPKTAVEEMYRLAAGQNAEDYFLYICENIAAANSEEYQRVMRYKEEHNLYYGVPYERSEEAGNVRLGCSVYETLQVSDELKAALADDTAQYCFEPVYWGESDFRNCYGKSFQQFKPEKARPGYICAVIKDTSQRGANTSWKDGNPRSMFSDLKKFLDNAGIPSVMTGNPQLASAFLMIEVKYVLRGTYGTNIKGYNCKVTLELINAADHKTVAKLEHTEILPDTIYSWHDGVAEAELPGWYDLSNSQRDAFLSAVAKKVSSQQSLAASTRKINAINAKSVLDGILLQQAEKQTGAWQKAILEAGAQDVRLKRNTVTFRLKGYQPNLKSLGEYAKAEDKRAWLAAALKNAQAYSLEVSMQLEDGRPTNQGLNNLQNKVNQAATDAQRAFANADMTKALREYLFPAPLDSSLKNAAELMEPADRFTQWLFESEQTIFDAPASAVAALYYAQRNQEMNWNGGPHKMVMTCTGVSPAQLLEDSAKAVLDDLAFKTADQRESDLDRQLQLRIADNGVAASKKTNNRFTITVDLDDIAAGRFPSEYMDWLAAFDWNGTLDYLDTIAGMLPYDAAIPMPKHGLYSGGQKGTTVNFNVDAASKRTYIVMKEAYTGKLAATAFCDPGKQVTVHVPSGDYVIVWGSGPYWYGEPLLFADLGSYNKSEIVSIAGSQYYHTYTLVASDDGDVGMYVADPEDLLGN